MENNERDLYIKGIPAELHKNFKKRCIDSDLSMRDKIIELMEEDIKNNEER